MKIDKPNQINISQINSNQNSTKKEKIETIGNDAVVSIDKSGKKVGDVRNATYGKPEKEEKMELQSIENQASVQNATQMKNEMVVAANTTSPKDASKAEEDGFSLQSTKIHTVVTVTDKIKLELAKAGKDTRCFGDDLTEAQLTEMTGNTGLAQQMEQKIAQDNQPVTNENVQDSLETVSMAGELKTPNDGAVKYMMDNSLAPTVANLYKAEFSGSTSYQAPQQNDVNYDQLMPQITDVITQSGLAVTDQTVAASKWLIANDIPLTAKNLTYMTDLTSMKLPLPTEQVMSAAVQSIAEGNRPQDAMLVAGYSVADQANHAMDVVNQTTDADLSYVVENGMELTVENLEIAHNMVAAGWKSANTEDLAERTTNVTQSETSPVTQTGLTLLTARRQLEETRLAMTAQANYSLLKQGISIDTKPLAELVDNLKNQENAYYRNLLQQDGIEPTEQNIGIFRNTMETVNDLKTMPSSVIGIKSVDVDTLFSMHEAGVALRDTFEKAGQSYDTMKTEVRRDLGDSIQKAFSNVDDILTDLGLDTNDANRRAVRILAYNSQSITEESIAQTKAADEEVQRAFKNLSPVVVREMIKKGTNPLDMTMKDLNEQAVQIKQDLGTENEERFSKYLWKLEQSHSISEEERSSYIGIYRLMNQVEQTDGAAVGALLTQGGEMTMRNLLTQVRSSNHSGMDYTVDDEFDGVSAAENNKLSITDQIEKGYQTNCLRDALDVITPERMKKVMQNENWQDMSPEQLSQALQSAGEDTTLDEAYVKQQLEDLSTSAKAPEEAYQMLADNNMPNTTLNVMAATALIQDRNAGFKRFFGETKADTESNQKEEPIDFKSIKEEILRRFGEAVKTPEDMAEAQKALADTAENVMKTMLIQSRSVNSMDIKAMKLLNAQISLGTASAKEENYAIPVLVGDEVTNVSLKIVRGKEKKGLVDMMFSTDGLGKIAAQLKATNEGISGYVASDRATSTEWLKSNQDALVAALGDGSDTPVDIRFLISDNLDLSNFGKTDKNAQATQQDGTDTGADSINETRQLQTKTLYHMAEAFLKTVKEMSA